jgi:hypothetical protein
MGAGVEACLSCGAMKYAGKPCPKCKPEEIIAGGVKNEPFDKTLANSRKPEDRVREAFLRAGLKAEQIPHVKGQPDRGDILVWNEKDGREKARTVDVKQAFRWTVGQFPFDHIMLTAEKELHDDWIYVITDTKMKQAAVVDMRKVPRHLVVFKQTTNRRDGLQRSAQVSVNLAKFYPIHAVSF